MKCPGCSFENPENARFCDRCGAKLSGTCPACGAANRPGSRFCGQCGSRLDRTDGEPSHHTLEDAGEQLARPGPLSPSQETRGGETEAPGQNRLVTVLFADISGFTPLSRSMAPEDLVGKVNQCFRIITDAISRHEGSINKFIGDCVLAFFGAPMAHENDPERAILSALEIQRAVAGIGLGLTVGINTGLIYFGQVGTKEHHEVSAYGMEVNLAQRLQSAATAGQIIVGERTYRLTRRSFEFTSLPPLTLKGIPEPMPAYVVAGVLPRPEKARGIQGLRGELVGREAELSQLRQQADELFSGRGQIACVVGQAGVGKSRLASELKAHAAQRGIRCLEGRCVSIGESVSYWLFIDIIRNLLALSPDDDTGQVADRITEQMRRLFPETWEDVVPYVANLLSVRAGARWDERIGRLNAEQVKNRTFLALRDTFVALARDKPLILILDDLHWADSISLDLLGLLLGSLGSAPIMLLCIYRPEPGHKSSHIAQVASAKCLDCLTEIHLKPLSSSESKQLVETLLSIQHLPERAREAILGKTGGNPFYVEEVIRSLIDSGAIRKEGGAWTLAPEIGDVVVPETVQGLIQARIDTLEEGVRYVLQSAAVIGRLFRHRLLRYVTQEEARLDQYLWDLEERDLIYEERTVPKMEYGFRHVLTQETAYATILSKRKARFHRVVGEGYEALYGDRLEEYYEDLAYHFGRSDDRSRALKYLVLAGDKAASRHANTQALSFFEQALTLAGPGEDYHRILRTRGRVYLELWRGHEAASDYERLLAWAQGSARPGDLLDAQAGLAKATYMLMLDDPGQTERATALFRAALETAVRVGDSKAEIDILVWRDLLHDYSPRRFDERVADRERIVALCRSLKDEELERFHTFGLLKLQGRYEDADRLAWPILESFRASGKLADLKEFTFGLMWFYLDRGDFIRCVSCCDAGTKLAADLGVEPVMYATIRAMVLLDLGRYAEAWDSLEREVADAAHPFGSAFKEFGVGLYFVETMDYRKAQAIFSTMVAKGVFFGRAWLKETLRIHLAFCNLGTGSPLPATAEPVPMGWTPHDPPGSRSPSLLAAESALARGRLDEALDLADSIRSAAERSGRGTEHVRAAELTLRILVRMGRYDDAVRLADSAIGVGVRMAFLPVVWRMRASKARALALLRDSEASAQEYGAAARIVRELASSIPDPEPRRTFLSDPWVAEVTSEAGG